MSIFIDEEEIIEPGTIRMFRNAEGENMFPSGLVRVLHRFGDLPGADYVVSYLDAPAGLSGRSFHADPSELTRPSQPVLNAEAWWVVVVAGFPTFYLNGAVQGITGKVHAAQVAASILGGQASVGPSNIDRLSDILS